MHETRGILTNTAWRAFADAASKVASIALYVVMARELGDAGFGVFTFALMYATLFTALAYFGQDAVLVREVARDRPLLGRYFGNTIALKLLLAVPVLLVALAILALVGASETTLIVTALLGLALTIEAALATVFAVFQAYERMRNIALVLIAQRFATAGVGIAALLAGAGVVAVAVIYVGGALLAVAIGLALLRQVGRPRLQVSPPTWPALMTAAVPLGIAGVFGTILFRIDTIILAAFESTAVVGDYGAAYRLLEATLFLGWAIGGAVYPVLSRLDLSERLADVFEQSLKLTLTATLPLAVGAAVLADPLVETLYGTDFDEAAPALQLLAPSIVLFPIAYVTGLFLIARRRQRFVAVLYGHRDGAQRASEPGADPRLLAERSCADDLGDGTCAGRPCTRPRGPSGRRPLLATRRDRPGECSPRGRGADGSACLVVLARSRSRRRRVPRRPRGCRTTRLPRRRPRVLGVPPAARATRLSRVASCPPS